MRASEAGPPTGTDEYTPRSNCSDGLSRADARPITPPEMNETVYLFALSVPDLLEGILAGQTGPRTPVVVAPRTERRA